MRRVLSVLLVILSFYCIIGLNSYTIIDAKITYELNQTNMTLSTEQLETEVSKLDEVCVITRIKYGELEYENNLTDDATMEEVDKYKETKRALLKKYHKTQNEKVFSTYTIKNYESYYISEYLPFIEFNFSTVEFNNNKEDILKKLSSHKDISSVTIKEGNNQYEEQILTAINTANALTYYEDSDYTGAGIKIGIMETGIVNASHANMTGTSVTTYDQVGFTETVTDHATKVATIIGGQYGLAPDASIYSTAITGNVLNEVDWLINRGVDVINMSYGEANPNGYYNSDSSFVDYAVKNYDIVGVAAIGNGGADEYIANPALAYNVISVGDIYVSGIPASYNSLKTRGIRGKPTLLAPGEGMTIPGYGPGNSGTSFSCALTTGCVALLLEEYPILKTKPMMVVSLFAAGCIRMPDYVDNGGGNGFSEVVGAGKINLAKTMDIFDRTTTIQNINPGNDEGFYIYEWDVYLSAGVNLRAVFSWAATANYVDDTVDFTNYTAVIFKDTGVAIAVGGSLYDNVSMASVITPYEGRYYIRLFMENRLVGSQDNIYFAYRYR